MAPLQHVAPCCASPAWTLPAGALHTQRLLVGGGHRQACCLPAQGPAGPSCDASTAPVAVAALQQPSRAVLTVLPGVASGSCRHHEQPLQQQQQRHQPLQQLPASRQAQWQHHQHQQQQHGPTLRPSNGNGRHGDNTTRLTAVTPLQQDSRASSSLCRGVSLERFISSTIKQCSSWQQVDAVVCEHGPAFNIIHVSAALTHLAQLNQRQQQPTAHTQQGPQQQQPQQQQHEYAANQQQAWGLQLVTSQMAQQHMQLQQLLQPLHSAHSHHNGNSAGTQLQPGSTSSSSSSKQQDLVQRLLRQAVPLLADAGPRQVANMLWALSVLQQPGSSSSGNGEAGDCIRLLVQRAAQLFSAAEPQHLSNMALAAARLQLPVSQEWLLQLQAAWLQLVRAAHDMSSSSSSSVVGSLEQQQQQEFVTATAFQGAAEQAARVRASGVAAVSGGVPSRDISPQATCNILWALVQLQQQPSQQWLQEVVAAASPQLQSWPPQSVAMLLWACARLGFRPVVQHSSAGELPAAVAAQSVTLQQQPDIEQHLVSALSQHARAFSCCDLSQSLWGAATMKLHVPPPTLQLLLTANAGKQLQQGNLLPSDSQPAAQQQGGVVPNSGLGHSVSVLLWSLGQLCGGCRQQLPSRVLQPWLTALATHATAAPRQSLGVAAWAAGQLGLTASCPNLLLHLVAAAARNTPPPPPQQQAGSSTPAGDGAATAAILWSAAKSVQQMQRQQQQQQLQQQQGVGSGSQQAGLGCQQQQLNHRQRLLPVSTHQRVGVHGTAAAAAGLHSSSSRTRHQGLQQAITTAAAALAQQLPPAAPMGQQGQQLSLWQLSLVLWSCSAMQLRLPASWWQQQVPGLLALLQQQQQQQQQPPAVDMQARTECAHAIAAAVWALGRSGVRLPQASVRQLGAASLPFLQQQGLLSQVGCVCLLLGFTKLATTSAAQLPAHTPLQRQLQQRRYRLLRRRLRVRDEPGRRRRLQAALSAQKQQKQQLQQGPIPACQQPPVTTPTVPGRLPPKHQQQQQRQQQQQQQLRGRGVMRKLLLQRQRHGWVAAAGLHSSWLRAYCRTTGPLVQQMPADSLAAVMWALGRLRYHPGSGFLAAAEQRATHLLPELGARHIALLLWSFARLQHVPDACLLEALLHKWETQLACAGRADTQQVSWAQRRLSVLQQQLH